MSDVRGKKARQRMERRERYLLEKDRAQALRRAPVTDPAVAAKQHAFAKRAVQKLLADELSLSFSKPVTELWSIQELPGYFEKVKRPMDLGTVLDNVESGRYKNERTNLFDVEAFRKDSRAVFNNAMSYNSPGTELYKLARRFLASFDKTMRELPLQRQSEGANTNDSGKKVGGNPSHHRSKIEKDGDKHMDNSSSEEDEERGSRKPSHKAERREPERAKPPKQRVHPSDSKSSTKAKHEDEEDEDREDGEVRDSAVDSEHHSKKNTSDDDDHQLELLNKELNKLNKLKAKAEGTIAEMDMERNVPMTSEERVKLRDLVERAPWERIDQVVKVLGKHVDKAIEELGTDEDPDFVTIELNDVEPHLLRDVEAIVNPDPRREAEQKKIDELAMDIEAKQSMMKNLKRALSGTVSSSKKKSKRRR